MAATEESAKDEEIDREYVRAYNTSPETADAWGDLNAFMDEAQRR